MKRMIPLFLVLVLLFAGCGAPAGSNGESSPPAQSVNEENGLQGELESLAEESPVDAEDPQEEQPDNSWTFDKPENHGVNRELLEALHEAVEEVEIRSIVTVKDGVIIDEYYKEDYDANSVFRLASCTKTFSGALIGIAIDLGYISGTEVKIAEYFSQVADSDDAIKQEITLWHLLTHTSGIQWNEWAGGTSFGELRRAENWVDFILEKPMAATPGTYFSYTTGGSHLLSAILQEATGVTEYEFAVEHLFAPLGMDSVVWGTDPQGISDGGNGIAMTARDAAKFGQLYLDGGRWKDQQIIPESWVEESVDVQDAGPGGRSGAYGYQWWLRSFGDGNYNTYYAMGHGGQFIFVVPELDLVAVMTSSVQDTYAPWPYFTDYILAACTLGNPDE